MKAKKEIACAASHVEEDWKAINWQKVNQNVRRLQARIVKATQSHRQVQSRNLTIVKPRPLIGALAKA